MSEADKEEVMVELTEEQSKLRKNAWAIVLNEMLDFGIHNSMVVELDGYIVRIDASLIQYPPIGVTK